MFKCTLVGAYEEAGVLTKLNVACKKYARIHEMQVKGHKDNQGSEYSN